MSWCYALQTQLLYDTQKKHQYLMSFNANISIHDEVSIKIDTHYNGWICISLLAILNKDEETMIVQNGWRIHLERIGSFRGTLRKYIYQVLKRPLGEVSDRRKDINK